MDQCWKTLAERAEEEVLDKYKVEESKREAFGGRGARWNWSRVRKKKKYRTRKWREDCWQEFSLCLQNISCSVCKACMKIGRRGDEAAVKNEGCEGNDEEYKIKSKHGR